LAGAACALAVGAAGLVSYLRRNPILPALLLVPCVLGPAVMLLLGRHLYPRFLFPAFGFAALVVCRGAFVCGEAAHRRLGRLAGAAPVAALLLASAASL